MPLRVLIVDDSPFIREVLREELSRFDDIEVVGEASDGKRAQAMAVELRPDVITMDVVMPMMGGMEAIRAIMVQCPTPIVVVSDAKSDVEALALEAVEAGAVDVFAKPRGGFDEAAAKRLVGLLRTAALVRMRNRRLPTPPPVRGTASFHARIRNVRLLGVVASTGGPQTLRRLLSHLPASFPIPIAIVQHTACGFTDALTAWLSRTSGKRVGLARAGERIEAGEIVVAPDDLHLEIVKGGYAKLHEGDKVRGHRPSGTRLLTSLARAYGAEAGGIVLTGMGDDGADGLRDIEAEGGLTMVEDPSTSILEGMPRAALERTHKAIVGSAGELGRMLASAYEGS